MGKSRLRDPGLWFASTRVEVEDVKKSHRAPCDVCRERHVAKCKKCQKAVQTYKLWAKLKPHERDIAKAQGQTKPARFAECADRPTYRPQGRRLKVTKGSGRHQTVFVFCASCGAQWIGEHMQQAHRAIRRLIDASDESIRDV